MYVASTISEIQNFRGISQTPHIVIPHIIEKSRTKTKPSFFSALANFLYSILPGVPIQLPCPLWNPLECIPPDSPLRDLAWHPYQSRFAILFPDDSVVVYDLKRKSWLDLRLSNSVLQQEASSLAWRPMMGQELAVACRDGICVWKIREYTQGEKRG